MLGPISSVQAFGKIFIIVNDNQTAVDLLDKRSSIYSERPTSLFAGEMSKCYLFTMSPSSKLQVYFAGAVGQTSSLYSARRINGAMLANEFTIT